MAPRIPAQGHALRRVDRESTALATVGGEEKEEDEDKEEDEEE